MNLWLQIALGVIVAVIVLTGAVIVPAALGEAERWRRRGSQSLSLVLRMGVCIGKISSSAIERWAVKMLFSVV